MISAVFLIICSAAHCCREAKDSTFKIMATFGDLIPEHKSTKKFSMEIGYENMTFHEEHYCGRAPRHGRTNPRCKSGKFDGSGLWF